MNERDSEAVAFKLKERGYTIVDHEDGADIILLNTCSVRDQAEQKAIGKAGHLAARKRKEPELILGVMGCMAQNRGEALLDRLPDLDLIVGTQKFHRVPDYLDSLIASPKLPVPLPDTILDIEEEDGSQNQINEHLDLVEKKVTAFVSIMQGCNMNCSFCIVPKNPREGKIQKYRGYWAGGSISCRSGNSRSHVTGANRQCIRKGNALSKKRQIPLCSTS